MGMRYVKATKRKGKKVRAHWRRSNSSSSYGNGHMSEIVLNKQVAKKTKHSK